MLKIVTQSPFVSNWSAASSDTERDEIVRLQFQCAALEKRLSDENDLRSAAASLQEQVAHLSRELAASRSECDRFISVVRSAAAMNRSSLDQIIALDPHSAAA